MKHKLYTLTLVSLVMFMLAACTAPAPQTANTPLPQPTQPPAAPVQASQAAPTQPSTNGEKTLTVMTHDSFAASEEVIKKFETDNQVKLVFVKSGDTGSALSRAILSKASPLADVFYGVDNTFLSRALQENLYEPYNSPALKDIPDEFKLDPQFNVLPVDYGDVCLNYDKAWFKSKNLALPGSLEDLTKPEYKNLVVVENPATSSPGLAFLFATIAHFGPDKYLDYWKALRQNGLVVVNDWESAYYTNFSGSTGKGLQPLVLSYASSPAVEFIFADPPVQEPPTGSINTPGTCFRQVEFVGILKGTQQRALAEKFVDFMLSTAFQNDIPTQMFVYPVNKNTTMPEAFQKFGLKAEQPGSLPPDQIAKNREDWIKAWTQAVLK
jgi:thiamine transport system substrate-binding protein